MQPSQNATVVFNDGKRGSIVSGEHASETGDRIRIRLENGQEVLVPVEMLQIREDGGYSLPLRMDQIPGSDSSESTVIPLAQEELEVGVRQVKSGIRITKEVHTREEVVDEPGYREEFEIERVPINQVLSSPVDIRQEGDTLIVPLMEELLVVEKRLVLREEVRITKVRREQREPQTVTLRSEEARIESLDDKESKDG